MSHPYESHKEGKVAKRRAKEMHGGAETGVGRLVKSAMAAHDKQQHGGKHTDLKVIGEYARGGRTKRSKKKGNNTKINIAIIGGGKGEPGGAPDLAGPPPAPPMAGPPPGPAAGLPPPGGMPGMPPGMPPKPPAGMPGMMQRGGKVPMKGGAETGVGRLDKIRAYGGKAKKG